MLKICHLVFKDSHSERLPKVLRASQPTYLYNPKTLRLWATWTNTPDEDRRTKQIKTFQCQVAVTITWRCILNFQPADLVAKPRCLSRGSHVGQEEKSICQVPQYRQRMLRRWPIIEISNPLNWGSYRPHRLKKNFFSENKFL